MNFFHLSRKLSGIEDIQKWDIILILVPFFSWIFILIFHFHILKPIQIAGMEAFTKGKYIFIKKRFYVFTEWYCLSHSQWILRKRISKIAFFPVKKEWIGHKVRWYLKICLWCTIGQIEKYNAFQMHFKDTRIQD